jgi:hypothetical protein
VVIFLVVLLVKVIFMVITIVDTTVMLLLPMLLSVYLEIRRFGDSEQQLWVLSCQGYNLGFQSHRLILLSTAQGREQWWRLWLVLAF